jgi:hypothetical protein
MVDNFTTSANVTLRSVVIKQFQSELLFNKNLSNE